MLHVVRRCLAATLPVLLLTNPSTALAEAVTVGGCFGGGPVIVCDVTVELVLPYAPRTYQTTVPICTGTCTDVPVTLLEAVPQAEPRACASYEDRGGATVFRQCVPLGPAVDPAEHLGQVRAVITGTLLGLGVANEANGVSYAGGCGLYATTDPSGGNFFNPDTHAGVVYVALATYQTATLDAVTTTVTCSVLVNGGEVDRLTYSDRSRGHVAANDLVYEASPPTGWRSVRTWCSTAGTSAARVAERRTSVAVRGHQDPGACFHVHQNLVLPYKLVRLIEDVVGLVEDLVPTTR